MKNDNNNNNYYYFLLLLFMLYLTAGKLNNNNSKEGAVPTNIIGPKGIVVNGTWIGRLQVDQDDMEYLYEIWRSRCALTQARMGATLRLTRWDPGKPSTCNNLVLMSLHALQKFDAAGGKESVDPQTARTFGYRGDRAGLFDAATNLEYGTRYLRGAWIVADGGSGRAYDWYRRGYYYEAKRKGLLEETGLR